MASYPTAEDEKRLLAAAETTTITAADDQKTKCRRACRRRMAQAKKAAHFTVTLAFVLACCVAVFGLGSLAIGTMRASSRSCNKSHKAGSAQRNGAVVAAAGGAAAAAPTGSFARLLEAVSPESLHDLLHEYLPDTYKHGVYPSEKHALEAIHRENAALATSIVQLARRDLNGTISSTPPSSTPTTSLPTSSTSSTFKNSSTSATTTSHTSSKTSSSSSTSKKVTVYTSTINGTPTVVTATSVVGADNTNGGSSPTNSGTLQTGAAVPMLAGNKALQAVAGVVVGAMLI